MTNRQLNDNQMIDRDDSSPTPVDQAEMLRMPAAAPMSGVVLVAPQGEVDICTIEHFREALNDAADSAERCVVVDLAGLTFCGSTGLVAMLGAQKRAAARGVGFRIAAASKTLQRVLTTTGVGGLLGLRDSVQTALAELADG